MLFAQVEIPELELEVSTGTLGGLITTVEGLVAKISETLKSTQVQRLLHFWACVLFAACPGGPSALSIGM
jgi:hypothetical protein